MRLHVPVEVRNHYNAGWDEAFEVVEERSTGLRLRRLSDGAVLPAEFPMNEVRPTIP